MKTPRCNGAEMQCRGAEVQGPEVQRCRGAEVPMSYRSADVGVLRGAEQVLSFSKGDCTSAEFQQR